VARKGFLDRVPHGLVHFAAIAESHFDLGRVHIHVHADGSIPVQRVHRLALAVQHVLLGAAHARGQHLVAHEAAVDVEELLVRARPRGVRYAGAASTRTAAQTVDPPRSAPTKSSPSRRPAVALRLCTVRRHCSTSLPSCQIDKPTSGAPVACRRTASTQCASSVASVFRNLRRAGVA
jgi:hypothetical protein